MDNNNNEKSIATGRDTKLRKTAIFVWWRVCFIISFLISYILVDAKSPLLHRLPKVLLISLAASVVLTFVLLVVVFPLANVKRKPFSALLKRLLDEGMTPEIEQELEAMYNKCKPSSVDIDYTQAIAFILANHYTEYGDYEKAHRYLDDVDNSMSFEYSNIPTYQERIMEYYALKIALEAADGGRTFAETAYSQAKHFYEKYSGTNKKNAYWAALGTAEYLLACGRPEEAAWEIAFYTEYKESKVDAFLMLAKASEAMGDTEKARKYINYAYDAATNRYTKDIIEHRRERLGG